MGTAVREEKKDRVVAKIDLVCECGYDFLSDEDWNPWKLAGSIISCQNCERKYRLQTDITDDYVEGESSDEWWLEKI